MSELPVLYSFRRCPYAMRARMALFVNDIPVELREVELKNKPVEMLEASPKATVPILILNDGQVIDESLDIIQWVLAANDKNGWLSSFSESVKQQMNDLITENDSDFKQHLDHYKYSDRFPEFSQQHYRQQGEKFLQKLNERLNKSSFLFGNSISFADIAIFPFVRQFAFVDKNWFDSSEYQALVSWLSVFLSSDDFSRIMEKTPVWKQGNKVTIFSKN